MLENVGTDNSENGLWHRCTESAVSPQPLQRVLLTHVEAISEKNFIYRCFELFSLLRNMPSADSMCGDWLFDEVPPPDSAKCIDAELWHPTTFATPFANTFVWHTHDIFERILYR
jgi:hypothetical protein